MATFFCWLYCLWMSLPCFGSSSHLCDLFDCQATVTAFRFMMFFEDPVFVGDSLFVFMKIVLYLVS